MFPVRGLHGFLPVRLTRKDHLSISKFCFKEILKTMRHKEDAVLTDEDAQRFQYNLTEVESSSMHFLRLCCDFLDIYQKITTNLQDASPSDGRLDKKIRRKSIQRIIRKSALRTPKPRQQPKESIFMVERANPGDISFMIEDDQRISKIDSLTSFVDEGLAVEDLAHAIGFMSSEDEGEDQEIKGFTQQINSEFLRKDLFEIWKDFNDICVLLFSKNLKDCVSAYRKSATDFMREHLRSHKLAPGSREDAETGEYANQILSESMHLDSSQFRRMVTQKLPGRETQANLDLAKMYRKQHGRRKERWVEFVFWGFLASSVIILILFFVLFYCNVFS